MVEQRHHSRDVGVSGAGDGISDLHHVGAARAETASEHRRVGDAPGHHEPGAVESGGGVVGERVPPDPVPPRVDRGQAGAPFVPCHQRGQGLAEGLVGGEAAQGGQVAPAHGGPEPGVGAPLAGGGQPEPFALEGVGGQVGATRRAGEEAAPVDRRAPHVRPGDGGGERGGIGGVRAEFDEAPDTALVEPSHAVGETDGVAQLPNPVRGVGELVVDQPPGQGGHDGNAGSRVGQASRDGPEVVEHGLHPRGVEGGADPQATGPPVPEAGDRFDDLGLAAGEHHRLRTVHGGE